MSDRIRWCGSDTEVNCRTTHVTDCLAMLRQSCGLPLRSSYLRNGDAEKPPHFDDSFSIFSGSVSVRIAQVDEKTASAVPVLETVRFQLNGVPTNPSPSVELDFVTRKSGEPGAFTNTVSVAVLLSSLFSWITSLGSTLHMPPEVGLTKSPPDEGVTVTATIKDASGSKLLNLLKRRQPCRLRLLRY